MILVTTLFILLITLLLGSTLVAVSLTQDRAGSTRVDMKKAFSAAEAGIYEAMYRLRLDPATLSDELDTACSATADPVVVGKQGTPDTTWPNPTGANFWKYNPPTCAWTYSGSSSAGYGNYLGGTAANLDSAGRTFQSSGSAHGGSGALKTSNLTDGASYTVTVAPVVGFVGGCWQYVDQAGVALGSCASVAPNVLFKVTATGTSRNITKSLSTMIHNYVIKPTLDGAVTASSSVKIEDDNTVIDGHNFDCAGANPSNSGSLKALTVPSGKAITLDRDASLVCTAGTGANCEGVSSPIATTLGALLLGPSAKTADINALNDYLTGLAISPANAPSTAFHGILYVNGDYSNPPTGSSGLLIVHNASTPAKLKMDDRAFTGLIITDTIEKLEGNTQVIGAIVTVESSGTIHIKDNAKVKYSKCVMDGLPKNFPYRNVAGAWHEQ